MAIVKYCAEMVDSLRRRCIISTIYISVLLFTVVSLLIYFIFPKEIIALSSISLEVFYFALLFAVLFRFLYAYKRDSQKPPCNLDIFATDAGTFCDLVLHLDMQGSLT